MRNKNKKNQFLLFVFTIITFITVFHINLPEKQVMAEETDSYQRIYDDADLLSTSEYNELEEMCISNGEEAGINIFILTHDDPDSVDGDIYIENFYDNGNYKDSVILLIDMHRRDVVLQGYGTAETYLHSKRLDKIRDTITPYLSDADYKTAFQRYIEASTSYMKDDSELNYDHNYSYDAPPSGNYNNDSYNRDVTYKYDTNQSEDDIGKLLSNVWFQLAVSLIIGAIVVGTMAYNSGGRMTAGSNTYLDPGHSGLIGRRDNYIRTTVTRVRKPTQNTGKGGFNAGGFRGGISSGGHSHSSSRGKF